MTGTWGTDAEGIYRRSIWAYLEEPRVKRRLQACEGVGEKDVFDAMNSTASRSKVIEFCDLTHRNYLASVANLESAEEKVGRAVSEVTWDRRAAACCVTMCIALLLSISGVPLVPGVAIMLGAVLCALLAVLGRRTSAYQLRLWLWTALLFGRWLALRAVAKLDGRAWYRELKSKAVSPVIDEVIDQFLGEDRDSLLLPDRHDGLRSPRDPEFQVANGAARSLVRKIEQIDGGTIAVSGPRGVGKTTAIELCLEEADFAVFAQAPASYAPHDFLTSLFKRVCEEFLRRTGYPVPEFVRLPHLHRFAHRFTPVLKRAVRWLAYAVPAAALVVLGLFATARSLEAERGDELRRLTAELSEDVRAHVLAVWRGEAVGTGLIVCCVGVAIWLMRRSAVIPSGLRRLWSAVVILCIAGLLLGPFVSLFFDPEVRRLASSETNAGLMAGMALLGLAWFGSAATLSAEGGPVVIGPWTMPQRTLHKSLLLFPVAAAALLGLTSAGRAILTDAENPLRLSALILGGILGKLPLRSRWRLLETEPKLIKDCRNQLYRLHTSQSTSAGGTAQLLSLGASYTTTLSTLPPNYPELVADFRDLLGRISEEYHSAGKRVIVAIDEVDRLGTEEQALAFLREIKAILGVPHVHYLISVAEDVGAAFVRRGLPYRDVTDSSLDEVVHVHPGSLEDSAAILEMRAPGITDPYVLLAHSLAGGIPRDLIRYGRRLMEIQDTTSHLALADISRAVILEELTETLSGFRVLLAKQQWSPENSQVLDSFRSLLVYLRIAGLDREHDRDLWRVLQTFAAGGPYDEAQPNGLQLEARSLLDEAAVYAYFSYTLLGIFTPGGFTRRRTLAALRGPDGDAELLGVARLELAVSPYSARPLIDTIRVAWGLTPSDARSHVPRMGRTP